MKNSKAFTLIELLAIIVILAVIAVITVPIILGVIDDAKKGAAKDSAYAYKKAISQYYYSKIMNDSEYVIPDGEYEISFFKNDGLVVGGQEPSDGWVIVKDKNVTDFSFLIGDYAVTYNAEADSIVAVKGGELALTPTMQLRENAKVTALAIVSGETGTTEISDITEGWVAFIDGTLRAYSISVTESGKPFIVTDFDVEYDNGNITSNNAVATDGTQVAEKTNAEQLIVLYKTNMYVKEALIAKKSSVTSEYSYTVSDLSSVTTNQPDDGWIKFKKINNIVGVVDYSLTYGTITVNYSEMVDGNYVSTFGTARNRPISIAGTLKADGATYFGSAQEVFYNPTLASTCRSSDAVSTTGTTTGCLRWYAYSFKGDYVNMILDHNINESGGVAWASKVDYELGQSPVYDTDGTTILGYTVGTKASSLGVSFPNSVEYFPDYGKYGKTSKGPLTVLDFLKTATSEWSTSVQGDFATHTINTANSKYTINYSGYKARLIRAQEIIYIRSQTYDENTSTSSISYLYSWLYENTSSTGQSGYFTSSPYPTNSGNYWYVEYSGKLDYGRTAKLTNTGVRPVITVPLSDLN